MNLFDRSQYPLLHSLGAIPSSCDVLIQEILKYNNNKTISFIHRNNRAAILMSIPSYRKLERYEYEWSRKDSLVDNIINIICQNCNSTKEDAARSFLKILHDKYSITDTPSR